MLRFLVTRPIAILLTTSGFVILGLIVLKTLPVSLLPDVPIPQITVHVSYPNTAARELENTVVMPLRHQLMQVGKLKDIHSQTRNGAAAITLEFEHGVNTNLAFIETNEKIDQITGRLPSDLERPRVLKANVTDIPVFYLSVFPKDTSALFDIASPLQSTVTDHRQLEIADLAHNILRRRIEQLPEVAFVDISGYATPEIVIVPNAPVFQSLRLTENDLETILHSNDLDLGSLLVQDGHYQYHIRFRSGLKTVEDVQNIWFRHGGKVLQLKEVAEVQLRPRQRQGLFLHNGREAVVFSVRKQAQAQLFAMKKSFGNLLEELRRDFPQLGFAVSNDQSELLEVSVRNLKTSLIWGALFAFFVLFLFFREWRSPVLIGVVIPVSLIAALFGFYLLEMSINVISLSGLILGVGLMVDNGIIVMENIRQFRSMGYGTTDACVSGAGEVIRPLISSALTTCSVFVPLVFLSGIGGALFKDQALSVTLALGSSLLVAYVLLPTILNLGEKKNHSRTSDAMKGNKYYSRSAKWTLGHRWVAILFFAVWTGAAFWAIFFLKKETFPPLSRQGIEVQVDWHEAISLEESRSRLLRLLKNSGGILESSSALLGEQQFLLAKEEQGINEAKLFLYGNAEELSVSVGNFFTKHYPSASITVAPLKTLFDEIFASGKPPLVAYLQPANGTGTPDLADVRPIVEWLHLRGIEVGLPPYHEQYEVQILREEALRYGVRHSAVYDKLRSLFSRHQIGTLRSTDSHIPIVTSTSAAALHPLINRTLVQNDRGDFVPLSTFARLERKQTLKTLTAGKTGESLDLNLPVYNDSLPGQIRAAVGRAGNLAVHFSGQAFEDKRTIRELSVIAGISMLLLYLILAAQFESLAQPLIVILTVPLGLAGALLTLLMAGQSLNLVSMIGIIVMSGIVVNDAILKVDLMNRLSKTMPLKDAIHLAGSRRLNPIIMTSATTILALSPILFSAGLGAELQQPLAWTVCGGLFAGTIASLYFVPVLYFLLARKKHPANEIFGNNRDSKN